MLRLIARTIHLAVDTRASPRVIAGIGIQTRLHLEPLTNAHVQPHRPRTVPYTCERQVLVRIQDRKGARALGDDPRDLRNKVGNITSSHFIHVGRRPLHIPGVPRWTRVGVHAEALAALCGSHLP